MNEEKGQLRLTLKITPWLSVQDKEFYSIGPAKVIIFKYIIL